MLLLPVPARRRGAGRAVREAARHDPERHPQGVHRARELHLPARGVDAADHRPVRLLPRARPAAGTRSRSPATTSARRAARPSRRSRSRWPTASPTCRRRSTPASTVDEFGPRLAFFFNGHNNVFQEVAKFRAARRMWAHDHARALRGDRARAPMMLRFHTQTGGVTLTAQQPVNNVVRVALQGFAAVCGGTQSLHTNGYDEALALPTERAAKIALRTQQIIGYESGAADTVDPFAGSYFVEALTDDIEARAQRADRQGRRARRLGQGDPVHHRTRSTRVGLGLPGALPHRPGHRRRRQQVRRGGDRDRGHPARRPRDRAGAGRAPEGVQGRPRPGARRPRLRSCATPRAGTDNLLPSDPGGAARPRLDGRGLRRDARRLRRVPAGHLGKQGLERCPTRPRAARAPALSRRADHHDRDTTPYGDPDCASFAAWLLERPVTISHGVARWSQHIAPFVLSLRTLVRARSSGDATSSAWSKWTVGRRNPVTTTASPFRSCNA